ncbi:MAG: hypothetical protein ABFC98_01155 [Candidatus Cloacimonas sp.]
MFEQVHRRILSFRQDIDRHKHNFGKLQLLCILAIVIFCQIGYAQTDSLQTGKLTNSGTLSQLPDSLDKAMKEAEQKKNADLFYNLGVDFFSRGEIGMANLYFLKALNINSAHPQARANLELSIHYSPDAKLYPERLFLVQVLYKVINFFSVNRLAIMGLVFLLLSAIALCWLLFYNPKKERALPILTLALCGIICLASYISLGIKLQYQKHNPNAVVIVNQTELLSPTSNNIIQTVHSGLIVKLVQSENNHFLVHLPNGQLGRLKKDALKTVI